MDCREQALKLLSFSDRTEREMRKRLAEKGFDETDIDETLDFLTEYSYIDDRRYAAKYAADSVKLKGHGPGRIRAGLLQKGVSRDIVDETIDEMETDPREQLDAAMERRFANADLSNPKERNRIFSYFARRGYSPHDIWGAINGRSAFEDIDDNFEE